MTSLHERELAALKLRVYLLEQVLMECYVRALTMGARPQSEGQRDVASLVATIGYRLERELQSSEKWQEFGMPARETAIGKLRLHVEALVKILLP